MKKKTSVDIILPNYNSSQFIAKTIKSVQNQSFKNWKLIIVDDCSDTKTKKILKRYSKNKKIKIYWMKKNRGAAYCRNLGLKKSGFSGWGNKDLLNDETLKTIYGKQALQYFHKDNSSHFVFSDSKPFDLMMIATFCLTYIISHLQMFVVKTLFYLSLTHSTKICIERNTSTFYIFFSFCTTKRIY